MSTPIGRQPPGIKGTLDSEYDPKLRFPKTKKGKAKTYTPKAKTSSEVSDTGMNSPNRAERNATAQQLAQKALKNIQKAYTKK